MSHRHTAPGQHEHEFEPALGLPEPLPAGEHIVWQGRPDWRHLARRAFHVRKLAIYFAIILLVRGIDGWNGGESAAALAKALSGLAVLASVALGALMLMAWLTARSAVYTITDRRVVMRIGIVLTLTLNLPFKRIVAADLRRDGPAPGDVLLRLAPGDKIAYLNLWPHARPWRLARPEPMLRSLPDADQVAVLLAQAWSKATGTALQATPALAPSPVPGGENAGHQGKAGPAWVTS